MDEVLAIDGGYGFGLLSRGTDRDPSSVPLVLLNSGLIHRIGPFRMYVDFARELAGKGINVFRFDLPRAGDGPSDGVSVDATIQAVFDTLARATGARHFAIGGICSAADIAWRIAQDDPRVSGVWLFDGFAHRGRWFRLARARRALARPPGQWPMLAWKLARRVRVPSGPDIQEIRDWPDPAQFKAQSSVLLARGVRILAMYTGGVSKYLLHRRQLDDTFGPAHRHAGLQVEFWPQFDHTLMRPADRARVLSVLGEWCAGFRMPLRPDKGGNDAE